MPEAKQKPKEWNVKRDIQTSRYTGIMVRLAQTLKLKFDLIKYLYANARSQFPHNIM